MRACHLNTCPVGIATQDPELRRRFPGSPSTSSTSCSTSPRRRGGSWRASASAGSRISSVASTCSRPTRRSRTGRRAGSTSRRSCGPDVPRTAGPPRARAGVAARDALDWQLIEPARAGDRGRDAGRGRARVRNVNRTVGGLLSHHVTKAHGAPGSRRDDPRRAPRLGRAVVRRLARAGGRADARRRRERLRRQGPVGRRARRASARRRGLRRGGERHRRQHRPLRRHRRQGVLPRPGRRAVRRAQLRRAAPSSRASATTAAST